MIESYRTVQKLASAEITIRRSRFIGQAIPVATEQEAVDFITSVKKQHSMATHNCSAYMIGERCEIQKQSDDGEPSGTAGKPILEVIRNMNLTNVAVVVTRYFGGIMLGAGGLIRAYTDGAVAGIAAAGPVYKVSHQEVMAEIDYTWLGKLENELHNRNTLMGDTEFTDKVLLRCFPVSSESEAFAEWLTDLTQGQGVIIRGEHTYIEHKELP
ncbi:YigZ family protein [Paenibacillus lutrae]|uniref:YigZ family protein n=1 Tax=Paenibacillus lutrae TaxID=2078573 RepID=A0A7X3FFI0_9BACL|nr:YigZ family protein [Paenibacillus lutrae]MVO98707.1 YigZ family protein [Paenibacillus lutrae]